MRISKDAFHRPDIVQAAAQVDALIGEKKRALQIVQELLAHPGPLTPELLKPDPTWDFLRDEPEFQKLLTRPVTVA
ncbi:MAG: hypothetical protein ABI233_11890 [Chthoniobacterales bacterium]